MNDVFTGSLEVGFSPPTLIGGAGPSTDSAIAPITKRLETDQWIMSRSEELAEFKESLGSLVEEAPELEEFVGFVESAEATSVLDHKTKELLSLAIGVVTRCDHCILWHTDAALEAGATHEEIIDALKVAVVMGGGPAMTYAIVAYETLLELEVEHGETD